MKNTNAIYFYYPKIKNICYMVLSLAFIGFGAIICWFALEEGDFFASLIGAFLIMFFTFLIYILIKRLRESKPYLILTDEELIINPSSKHSIPIKWVDIEGYNIREVNFNKFIEIELYDEEKYRLLMSENVTKLNKLNDAMNFRLFAIVWGQVKRQDRDKLVHELDRRTFQEEDGNSAY
ncbi:STM3941 family protein [Gracilibacillus sp. D59]|uniref:STM3941 family protein n=1 Tax=Gracilibacillus sp. D59 TaxID=3457434 RepID=UPI003FCCFE26